MILHNEGAVFVFNPTSSASTLSVVLNQSLGFDGKSLSLTLKATGSSNRAFKPYNVGIFQTGAQLNMTIPATTALVFEFTKQTAAAATTRSSSGSDGLVVFGGAATATIDWTSASLSFTNSEGPAGEDVELVVAFPALADGRSPTAVSSVTLNGGSPIAVTVVGSSGCDGHGFAGFDGSSRLHSRCVESIDFHGLPALRIRGHWGG
jgi:hypothetical protein